MLDTVAGSSFVDLAQIPIVVRSRIEHSNVPEIYDANRNQLNVLGSLNLWLRLGSQVIQERFIVCRGFAVPFILGCTLMNRSLCAILSCEKRVRMKNSSCAQLITSRKFTKWLRRKNEADILRNLRDSHKTATKQKQGIPVKVAKHITIQLEIKHGSRLSHVEWVLGCLSTI